MEIIVIIICIVVAIIIFSGMSGVGIKSSLIREIHRQCIEGSSRKNYPSISVNQAYNSLKSMVTKQIKEPDGYTLYMNVNGISCCVILKQDPYKVLKTGCTLTAIRA